MSPNAAQPPDAEALCAAAGVDLDALLALRQRAQDDARQAMRDLLAHFAALRRLDIAALLRISERLVQRQVKALVDSGALVEHGVVTGLGRRAGAWVSLPDQPAPAPAVVRALDQLLPLVLEALDRRSAQAHAAPADASVAARGQLALPLEGTLRAQGAGVPAASPSEPAQRRGPCPPWAHAADTSPASPGLPPLPAVAPPAPPTPPPAASPGLPPLPAAAPPAAAATPPDTDHPAPAPDSAAPSAAARPRSLLRRPPGAPVVAARAAAPSGAIRPRSWLAACWYQWRRQRAWRRCGLLPLRRAPRRGWQPIAVLLLVLLVLLLGVAALDSGILLCGAAVLERFQP